MTSITILTAITGFIVLSTLLCLYIYDITEKLNNEKSVGSIALDGSIFLFNNINLFICYCEIALGKHIRLIQSDYKKLLSKYGGEKKNELQAVIDFANEPISSISELFALKTWSKLWSNYSLYDPSYQNNESFGFFIDVGNGYSTIIPLLLMNYGIIQYDVELNSSSSASSFPLFDPFWIGCIGIASYWQIQYGTIIYFLSYVFNGRYKNRSWIEVFMFVVVINGLWLVFPILGIMKSIAMIRFSFA